MRADKLFLKKSLSNRLISSLLAAAFLCLDIFPPSLNQLYAQPLVGGVEGQDSHSLNANRITPENMADLTLPLELGMIESLHPAKSGNRWVFLLQDAHSIPEAQKSLQGLVQYFQKNYSVNLIALEGAAGKIDATLFKSFPDPEKLESVFRDYLDQGELSGAAAASVLSPYPGQYYGVENPELYEKAVAAFLENLPFRPLISERVKQIGVELEGLKKQYYSAELKALDEKQNQFEESDEAFTGLLTELSRHIPAEAKSRKIFKTQYPHLALILEEFSQAESDQEALEREAREIAPQISGALDENKKKEFQAKWQAFQSGESNAEIYLAEMMNLSSQEKIPVSFSVQARRQVERYNAIHNMRGWELFDEVRGFSGTIFSNLAQSQEARGLVKLSSELALLNRLAMTKLTRKDWDQLTAQSVESENPDSLLGIARKIAELKNKLTRNYPAYRFYQISCERDTHMTRNLSRLMTAGKHESAVLVTGGFHTAALGEMLSKENISYAVVLPKVSQVPDESVYENHMKGEVSWQKFIKTKNGRINPYDAFTRAASEKLLSEKWEVKSEERSKNYSHNSFNSSLNLKHWRDQLIRDLSRQKRISQAHSYTGILDRLTWEGMSPADRKLIEKQWESKLAGLVKALEDRKNDKDWSAAKVMNLMGKTTATAWTAIPFVPGRIYPESFLLPSRIPQGSFSAKSEVRGTSPDAVETLQKSTDAVSWYRAIEELRRDNPEKSFSVIIRLSSGIKAEIPMHEAAFNISKQSAYRYLASWVYNLSIIYGANEVGVEVVSPIAAKTVANFARRVSFFVGQAAAEKVVPLYHDDFIMSSRIQELLAQDLGNIRETLGEITHSPYGISNYANAGKEVKILPMQEFSFRPAAVFEQDGQVQRFKDVKGIYLGVDVGGGSSKWGLLVDGAFHPLPEELKNQKTVIAEQENGAQYVMRFANHALEVQRWALENLGRTIDGVGIVMPGAADIKNNRMATLGQIPNVKEWTDKDIESVWQLTASVAYALKINPKKVIVRNDMDGVLSGVASLLPQIRPDFWQRTNRSFAFNWMGTGHGFQFSVTGEPYPGPTEAGHLVINFGKPGENVYDTESRTSIPNLVRAAKEAGFPADLSEVKPIGQAAADSNHRLHEQALNVFRDEFAHFFARNAATVYLLTKHTGAANGSDVVLGGGIARGQTGPILKRLTEEQLASLGFDKDIKIEILPEEEVTRTINDPNDFGALGAASLALANAQTLQRSEVRRSLKLGEMQNQIIEFINNGGAGIKINPGTAYLVSDFKKSYPKETFDIAGLIAGSVISNIDGMNIFDQVKSREVETADGRLLHLDLSFTPRKAVYKTAEDLTRKMTQEWPLIREKGFLAFDMQKTLAGRRENAVPQMIQNLAWLMEQDIRIVINSGNTEGEVMDQVVKGLIDFLKSADKLPLVTKLTVYSNSGTLKTTFNEKAESQAHPEYQKPLQLDPRIETALSNAWKEMKEINLFTGSNPEAQKRLDAMYEKDTKKTGTQFDLPWIDSGISEPSIVREAMPAKVTGPYIHLRNFVPGENGYATKIGITRFLPETRPEAIKIIKRHIRRQFVEEYLNRLNIGSGGESTIDIVLASANKALALVDYVKSERAAGRPVDLQYAYFAGDELTSVVAGNLTGAEGAHMGNDAIVFTYPYGKENAEFAKLNGIAVTPEAPAGFSPETAERIYDVRGEQQGMEAFLTRLFPQIESANVSRSDFKLISQTPSADRRSEVRAAATDSKPAAVKAEDIQKKIKRVHDLKQAARARAAWSYRANRDILALFETYRKVRTKNPDYAAAILRTIKAYASEFEALNKRISPDSESRAKEKEAHLFEEIEGQDYKALKVSMDTLGHEIKKEIIPQIAQAYKSRDNVKLDALSEENIYKIKARIKAQIRRILFQFQRDQLSETALLSQIIALSEAYLKQLADEYGWRYRRAVAEAGTEKIKLIGRFGALSETYDYSAFRIFVPEKAAESEAEPEITMIRNYWERVSIGPNTVTYQLKPRELKISGLDRALRMEIHTLVSQEQDYTQMLFHINAIDYVIELLKDFGENLTEFHKDQIAANLTEVLLGDGGLGKPGARVEQKLQGAANIRAALADIPNGKIKEAISLLEATRTLLESRKKDIEHKKLGIARHADYITHEIRREETRRAMEALEGTAQNPGLIAQGKDKESLELLTLLYQTHYLPVASSYFQYDSLKTHLANMIQSLKRHQASAAGPGMPENLTANLKRVKLMTQSRAARSEVRLTKEVDYAGLKGLENVKNSTVISLQMEMGYSAGFLKAVEAKFGKKIADQVSQATLTGGLGALMHDLFPSWKANGLDIIGIHPIWEEIKKKPYPEGPLNLGQYQRQVMEEEMAKRGESAVEFTIDLPWDDDYKGHADGNEKSRAAFGKRVYIRALKEYTSQYDAPNYHLDAYYLKDENKPDTEDNRHRVFDTVYSDDHNSWREYHMALYGRASEKLIKLLKGQGVIKVNSVEIHNEVFVSVPKEEVDPNRTLVHINHSAYLPTIYSPDVLSYGLLGFPQWMKQYIVKDGRSISLVDFAALNYDMLTGVAIDEHFWVLRRNIFRNAGGRLDHYNDGEIRSTNGVLTEHWQSLPLQALIEHYRIALGLPEKVDSAEFYKTLEANDALREEFITRQEFIKAAEAANFLGWMADTQNQPAWLTDTLNESGKTREDLEVFFKKVESASNSNDANAWADIEKQHSALRDILLSHPMVSNVRRQVPYKGPEKWIEVLKSLQASPEKLAEFKKSKIRVIIGGRTFSHQADDEFRQMAKIVKDLGLENYFAFIEDYNVYDAAIMFRAMAGVVMLSDELLEASATSMMKGVVNGAAPIGVWGGAMPELFKILDENGKVVDIFKKKTPHNLVVRNLRSKKWKLVNGYIVRYSNEKSHQAGGGRRPEAEALASSLLWLHEQYAETTKRRELLWHSVSGTPKVDMREGQARAHMQLIERLLREKSRVQTDIFEKLSFNPEDFQEILKEDAEKFVWRRNENELFKTGDNSPPGLFGLVNMFREISTYGSGDERGKAAIEAIQYHSLRGNILNNRVNNPDSYILYEIRNLPPSFQPFTDEIKKLAAETGPIIELLRRIKEDPEMEGEYIAGLNRLTNLNISALELIEKLGLWIARQAFEAYINQRDPKAAEILHKNIFLNHFIKKYLSRYLDRHAEAVPLYTKNTLMKAYGIVHQGKPFIFGINLGEDPTHGSGRAQHKAYTHIPHSESLRKFARKFFPGYGKALEKNSGAVYRALNAMTGEKYSFYDLAKPASVISLGLPDPEGVQLLELERQEGPVTDFLVATRVESFDTQLLENFLKNLKSQARTSEGKISQEIVDAQIKQIAELSAEIARARFEKYLPRVMGMIVALSPKYLDIIKDWDTMLYAALKKSVAENSDLFERGEINFHDNSRQQTVVISRSINGGENGQNIIFAIEFSEEPVNLGDGKVVSRVQELAPLKLNPTHEYEVINRLSGIAYEKIRTGTELMDGWTIRIPVRDFYERGEKIRHGWGIDIYQIRSVTPRFDWQSQAQAGESQRITVPNLILGVSVLDSGAVYDNASAAVSSSGALKKLSELVPAIEKAGFGTVYPYGGNSLGAISKGLHAVDTTSIHWLSDTNDGGLPRVLVSVSGYETKKHGNLRDNHGNPFSPLNLSEIDPRHSAGVGNQGSSVASERLLKDLSNQMNNHSIQMILDFIHWRAPESVNEKNYKQYFYRELSSDDSQDWKEANSDIDRLKIMKNLTRSGGHFVVRINENGTERPVLVQHMFNEPGRDQTVRNPFHPDVIAQSKKEIETMIDRGAKGMRIDLAHKLLNAELKRMMDEWLSQGWITDPAAAYRADYEPLQDLIDHAKRYAKAKGSNFQVIAESYMTYHHDQLRKLGVGAVYYENLSKDYVKLASGSPEINARNLAGAIENAFKNRDLFSFPANYDIVPLKSVQGSREAFLLIMVILAKIGVPVMLDVRELMDQHGQLVPIPGRDHPFPTDAEIQKRRDFDHYRWQFEQSPFVHMVRRFLTLINGRKLTDIKILDNQNRDQFISLDLEFEVIERGQTKKDHLLVILNMKPYNDAVIWSDSPFAAAPGEVQDIATGETFKRDGGKVQGVVFPVNIQYRILSLKSSSAIKVESALEPKSEVRPDADALGRNTNFRENRSEVRSQKSRQSETDKADMGLSELRREIDVKLVELNREIMREIGEARQKRMKISPEVAETFRRREQEIIALRDRILSLAGNQKEYEHLVRDLPVIFSRLDLQLRRIEENSQLTRTRSELRNQVKLALRNFAAQGGQLVVGNAGQLSQLLVNFGAGDVAYAMREEGENPIYSQIFSGASIYSDYQTQAEFLARHPDYSQKRNALVGSAIEQTRAQAHTYLQNHADQKLSFAFAYRVGADTSETLRRDILSSIRLVKSLKEEYPSRVAGNIKLLMPSFLAKSPKFSAFIKEVESSGVAKMIWMDQPGAKMEIERYLEENQNALVYGRFDSGLVPEKLSYRYMDSKVSLEAAFPVTLTVTAGLASTPKIQADELRKALPDMLPGVIRFNGTSFEITSAALDLIYHEHKVAQLLARMA